MKGRGNLATAGAVISVFALSQATLSQPTFAAQACPDSNACVQVSVGSAAGAPGGTVNIPITFKQGPDNGQAGGVDEIAALALTLSLGTGQLTLADCALNADGLPGAVKPDASVSNFKVVVENASCGGSRTHCLCPDNGSGITPDNFINLVVYGPNPLPTPGPTGIDIPPLPSGPPPFVSIDLKVADGTVSGQIPLHVYNETDTEHPQFTALLSVGDKTAVDQTCVPVPGSPPCSSTESVSQVAITDGSVDVQGPPSCAGDCDGNTTVSVNELITMVNIALGAAPVSTCTAGDLDSSGTIEINEIITAVNNALNGCPVP